MKVILGVGCVGFVSLAVIGISLPSVAVFAADSEPAGAGAAKSPEEELPPHITRLTRFGERPDWSHDGKRLIFVERRSATSTRSTSHPASRGC